MGSRYRRAPPPEPSTDSDDYTDEYILDEQDIQEREANDRRLRQAISYLASHGGPDPLPQFKDRVNKIDEYILRQYREEGYSFDPQLYRQLREMVRDQLNEFNVDDEDSDDVEEVYRDDALYRDSPPLSPPLSPPDPGEGPSTLRGLRPQVPTKAPAEEKYPVAAPLPSGVTLPPMNWPTKTNTLVRPRRPGQGDDNEVREIAWSYGGPLNEPEEWWKDYPPSLPFGETLHMQEWESLKVTADLARGPFEDAGDAAVVENNVPFSAAARKLPHKSPYDSGSRFTLPQDAGVRMQQLSALGEGQSLLLEVVAEFNGGDKENLEKKDYAPRIFLERILGPRHNSPRRQESARQRAASLPSPNDRGTTTAATPRRASSGQREAGSSSRAAIKPGVASAPTLRAPRTSAAAKSPEPVSQRRRGRPKNDPASTPKTPQKGEKRKANVPLVKPTNRGKMGKKTGKSVAFTQQANESKSQPPMPTRASSRATTARSARSPP